MAWEHYTDWLAPGQGIGTEQLRELMLALDERMHAVYGRLVPGSVDEVIASRMVGTRVSYIADYDGSEPSGLGWDFGSGSVYPLPHAGAGSGPGTYTADMISVLLAIGGVFMSGVVDGTPFGGLTGYADRGTAAAAAILAAAGMPCTWAQFLLLRAAGVDDARVWNFLRAWIIALDWVVVARGVSGTGRPLTEYRVIGPSHRDPVGPASVPWTAELWAEQVAGARGTAPTPNTDGADAGAGQTSGAGGAYAYERRAVAWRGEAPIRLSPWEGWRGATLATFTERRFTSPEEEAFANYGVYVAGSGVDGARAALTGAAFEDERIDLVIPAELIVPPDADYLDLHVGLEPAGWEPGVSATRRPTAVDFGPFAGGFDPYWSQYAVLAGSRMAVRPAWVYG